MNRSARASEERGVTRRLLPLRISSLILIFAAVLIAAFTGAMLYVGKLSSEEADQQARASEVNLFRHVLASRFIMLARDQTQESIWDESVRNISLDFDPDFVSDETATALWYNYGLDRTLLVGPDKKLLAYARGSEVDFSPTAFTLDADMQALIDKAVAQYMKNRITIKGGYSARAATIGDRAIMLSEIGEIFSGAFQTIEGKPALVSATAIVPYENEVALPDGPPVILVNAKFIDTDEVSYLRSQLGFQSLDFVAAGDAAATTGTREDIKTLSGQVVGTFVWQNALPGAHIWSVILPIVGAIGALVAAAALLMAQRLGKMSNQLETSERRTRHLSRHDALTGLANRLSFGEALEEAVAGLPDKAFAVVACDLDRFKAVNDTFGHGAGDIVIRTVGERLAKEVGESGVVSRTGGDEFIILVHAFTDKRRLNLLCTGIIDAILKPIRVDNGQETDVGVSLGVAQAPLCGITGSAVMRAADEALYAAKQMGRGRAVFAEALEAPQDPEAAPIKAAE
ncbi:diguanylate cyclase domain-containing protein [Dongia sp.]|uniref:sensor domain-containing diguanylate cyclase n=1 Tax=Dongia sp. TaxID=1977262 RepID=UPI0037500E4D